MFFVPAHGFLDLRVRTPATPQGLGRREEFLRRRQSQALGLSASTPSAQRHTALTDVGLPHSPPADRHLLRVAFASQVPTTALSGQHSAGAIRDDVELVAFPVGQRDPVIAALLDLLLLRCAEADEPLNLGCQVAGDQIRVESVLRGLSLWNLVEHPLGLVGRGVGQADSSELLVRAVVDRPV